MMRTFRCSAVVGPERKPSSASACRTQRRSVSAVQPIFWAIDSMAAHCDSYSPCESRTMRTERSTTSGENFGDFLIAPFSSEGASTIPGAIQPGGEIWVATGGEN